MCRAAAPLLTRNQKLFSEDLAKENDFLRQENKIRRSKLGIHNRDGACNAYAERFVREIRETLDQLILLGEEYLRHVPKKIEHHYNRQRRRQGLGQCHPATF